MARLLIIDDSVVMRQLMLDYLTHIGHIVTSCDSGKSGIERALLNDFDVVICDLHMPKVDGCQVLEAIMVKKPFTKFIFTDSMPDQLAERVKQLGHNAYLKKPFELLQLRALLDSILIHVKTT